MAADDAAASEDRSEREKDIDLKTPPLEGAEGHGDVETAMASAPSEEPVVDPVKLKWSVIYLCFYGFMSSIRPGEAFITPTLLSSEKNFTREQVSDVLFRLVIVALTQRKHLHSRF